MKKINLKSILKKTFKKKKTSTKKNKSKVKVKAKKKPIKKVGRPKIIKSDTYLNIELTELSS